MSALESAACARVHARIELLLEGELSAVEEARDRGHMEACGPCARELEARRAWRREFAADARVDDAALAWWTAGLDAQLAAARAPERASPRAPVHASVHASVHAPVHAPVHATAPSTEPQARPARLQPLRRALTAAALAAAALVALALADAWSGARSGARPIEELFAAAPRPKLTLERFVLEWPQAWRFGEERTE